MAANEAIVSQELTRDQALERLAVALEPRYALTRTPVGDELYVKRFPGTYAIVKVIPLSGGRTRFEVKPDWGPLALQWLYGRLVACGQVARAIDAALT